MKNPREDTVESVIKSNRDAIENPLAKFALRANPGLLVNRKKGDVAEIQSTLKALRDEYEELRPFVVGLRKHVISITEETHICSVYLLLCQALKNWESFFLLAENGRYTGAMVILRTIKEGVALVDHFCLESHKSEDANLKKWFAGEIITHGSSRKARNDHHKERTGEEDELFKELQGHLYQVESQAVHNSYGSVLECVSPFTQDFDFEEFTGFYRTVSAVRYAKGSMTTTALAIKGVYLFLLKDAISYEKVDEILVKFDPKMADGYFFSSDSKY